MAGDYVFPEDTVSAAPTRFEKFLRLFIVAAVLCLGGELVWLLGITPFRPFSKIDVSGCDEIEREEILAKAGITKDSSYLSTNERAVEKALGSLAFLDSVQVFKHFPDRLEIVLENRQAVGSILANLDGRTVPVLFDSQGVVFQIGGEAKLQDSTGPALPSARDDAFLQPLPVISGLVVENPVPGMRLPAMFIPLFKELEKIETSAPELLAAVSELRINRKSYEGFDLVLYPVHKKIKVRLSELNEDLLRYTLLMVDVLAAKEPGTDTLDFRSGIASYIPKEASSE